MEPMTIQISSPAGPTWQQIVAAILAIANTEIPIIIQIISMFGGTEGKLGAAPGITITIQKAS